MGDGVTWVALAWLVASRPDGAGELGLLGVCYTAPVALGGMAVGPLLDRFDKRLVLITDSLFRAVVVASLPVCVAVDAMPSWLPFAIAAVHGLLKMAPLAGFPAAIPQLIDDRDLDAANALENLSYGVATALAPAAAGLLIGWIGAAGLLLIDSASFLVFALAAASIRRPLRPLPTAPVTREPDTTAERSRPTLARLGRDRVIVATTISFMAFNIAEGMLLVTAPWLADGRLLGGPTALGLLLSAMAAGEIVGAAVAGGRRAHRSETRAIGVVQAAAAAAFLALLTGPHQLPVAAGLFAIGLFSAPMTIWAQSLRMRRIPEAVHGRAFAALRTLMQATPAVGSVLVSPLLADNRLATAAIAMTTLAGLPALYLILTGADRHQPITPDVEVGTAR
jgi:MFS family permease